jgi:hypothetical protein
MGQGGNRTHLFLSFPVVPNTNSCPEAIESSATLTNLLHTLLSSNPNPPTSALKTTLQEYQSQRVSRTKTIIRLSNMMTQDHSLATLYYTLKFLDLPQLSTETLTGMLYPYPYIIFIKGELVNGRLKRIIEFNTELYTSGPCLDFLPKPQVTIGNKYWEEDDRASEPVRAR